MKRTIIIEQFLKEIESLNNKVDKLKVFETNARDKTKTLDVSELKSFSWLENSPVCTKIVDLDFNLQYMSRSGIDKLKIGDISPYYGKPYPLSFYSDSFKIPMQECLHTVKKTKAPITQEASILDSDGNELWFQSTLIPIKNIQNNIDYFMIVSLDITERKKVEQSIIKTKEFNEALLNTTPDIVYVYDLIDHKNVYSNDGNMKILGYSQQEVLDFGKNHLSNLMHPEDSEVYKNEILPQYQSAKDGAIIVFEYRVKHKNGNWHWLQSRESVFNRNKGKVTQIIGVADDITKRKKAEEKLKTTKERLKSTFNLSPSIIASVNIKTGYFTDASAAVTRILGYTVDEFTSIPFIKLIHQEDIEKTKHAVSEKLKGNDVASFENRYLCKNGTYKWIAWQGTKPDENGIITAIGSDLSDKKQVEEDLKKSIEELEKYRQQLETENVLLKKEISLSFNYEDMVYSSEEISNVLNQVEQVAKTDATVLILGETGTGKELIAKAIHKTSSRKNNSLIRVNCAAIPSELIESELFGHTKGSFTGAIENRIGKFELADGGTIFLDEIGELPLALQPKLLRAIQEGEIEPIGSSKIRKLDVRIIAATNKDLKKETEDKSFREDLYFRLNVFPITIPPLRNRIEDIPVLIDHFVNKYSKKHGKVIKYITDLTLQQMKSYAWPGNIRELENVIERAVIVSNQDLLIIQEFDNSSSNIAAIKNHTASLDEVQRNHIIKVLNETQWTIDGHQGAAIVLGLKPSTLRDRMKKLGIKRL
ncbi:sigma 54-interacting transcriptional regulator [Pontimicrobium sp. SW4]|uniref:Sigma 54-interacting transcriptional regulator n=1 Tax=Pontimicrobium sp. SW4 TaxID=3153519 RepID=A0AAU7BVS6_9FLAO